MATANLTRGDNRLTDTGLRRARLNNGQAILQDGGGLILEVTESGGRRVARAVYRFRFGDKRPDMRLGTWPDKSLADLRELRNEARALVRQGKDPRGVARERKAEAERLKAEEQADKARAAARLTVAGAFDKWDNLHLRRSFKDGGAEVRRYFEKDVLPNLGALPIEDLNRARVAAVVDQALEREAPRSAQMLLGYVRQFCRWCLSRGYLDADPSAAFSKAAIKTNGPRERVLSEFEIRELARLLPLAALPKWGTPAVWLLLATAARVGELLGARWDDFDLEANTWTIPAENAKNGRAHVIDLSDFALARLAELAALRTSSWLVAGRALEKDGAPAKAADEKALTKLLKDRQRPEGYTPMANRKAKDMRALVLSGGDWTPHDLRRTAATLMQGLGVAPAVIEKALNHAEVRRLVAVYQRHDYRAERRDAFNRLGDLLHRLTSGESGRVVALRRA
jgi:integrase